MCRLEEDSGGGLLRIIRTGSQKVTGDTLAISALFCFREGLSTKSTNGRLKQQKWVFLTKNAKNVPDNVWIILNPSHVWGNHHFCKSGSTASLHGKHGKARNLHGISPCVKKCKKVQKSAKKCKNGRFGLRVKTVHGKHGKARKLHGIPADIKNLSCTPKTKTRKQLCRRT